jgi:hypothetical protein
MLKKLSILVILVLVSVPAFAQMVDTAWVRRYNGPADSYDAACAIVSDNSGNVYVTGWSLGSGTSWDYATIKYKPNGDTAWVRRYNGPENGQDVPYAIALDNSGNVYVTGYDYSGTGNEYATVKYYPNGDTAWVRRYTPGSAYDLAVDDSGNVYVTGESYPGSGSTLDYATVKYHANGDTAWVRRYSGPVDSTRETNVIAVDNSGNVYVAGEIYGVGSNFDYVTIKYYPNGDTAWVKRYNGPGNFNDEATAIAQDDSGNVYVTGYSMGSGTYYDYATIKYKPNGDTAWVRRYNGSGDSLDLANGIAVDNSGNVYVTGYSWVTGRRHDYTTIKYKPNGDTAWVRIYDAPGHSDDVANAIALDGAGNIYVTGGSMGAGTSEDYATIKYKPNGDTAWIRRYDGPANNTDEAKAIAVGKHGNVYVTGMSAPNGIDLDYTTIKYSPKSRSDTLRFMAYSPVDLIVTDPVLDSIGVNFNTIPGAFYDTTTDLDNDGDKDDRVVIPNPIMGEYMVRVVPEPGGSGNYTLAVKLDGNEDRVMIANAPCPGPGQVDTVVYTVPEYLHGDANRDGKKTVSDVVFLINYLFKGGPAPDPVDLGDVNFCKQNPPVEPGQPTVADVVYMINYLFKGGKAPCS